MNIKIKSIREYQGRFKYNFIPAGEGVSLIISAVEEYNNKVESNPKSTSCTVDVVVKKVRTEDATVKITGKPVACNVFKNYLVSKTDITKQFEVL